MSILRPFSSLFHSIVNAVIPPRGSEHIVAQLSLEDLERLRTEEGLPYHDAAVRAFIWELKYNRNPRALQIAGEFLAEELLGIAEEELGKPLLVPVPMHKSRRRERGHNQTELLCDSALRSMGGVGSSIFDYAPNVLERVKNTPAQQGLPRRKRLLNIRDSMEVVIPEKVKGRVCVVVDDVSTTGATLEEAKRALKAAGARRVHTVALARS